MAEFRYRKIGMFDKKIFIPSWKTQFACIVGVLSAAGLIFCPDNTEAAVADNTMLIKFAPGMNAASAEEFLQQQGLAVKKRFPNLSSSPFAHSKFGKK